MEPSCGHRSRLLTAGGVLSLIAGAIEVLAGGGGLALIVNLLTPMSPGAVAPGWVWVVMGLPFLALGIVAILGGAAAMKRKGYGLSLAGAICALPLAPMGIPAVIFVVLRKREFEPARGTRGGLLKAGGVLSIVAGAYQMIWGATMTGVTIVMGTGVDWLTILQVSLLALGVVAIVGGVSALRRAPFSLSLAGAICALPSLLLLGILAVAFVAVSKREFRG